MQHETDVMIAWQDSWDSQNLSGSYKRYSFFVINSASLITLSGAHIHEYNVIICHSLSDMSKNRVEQRLRVTMSSFYIVNFILNMDDDHI